MKKLIKVVFISAFILTTYVYLHEILWLYYFKRELKNNRYGVPEDSSTYKLAINSEKYISNMILAVDSRIVSVKEKILYLLIYLAISSVILSDRLRLKLFDLCKNNINAYTKTYNNISKEQVAFTNIFVFLFIIFYLYDYLNFYCQMDKYGLWFKLLWFLIIYLVLSPLLVILIFFLLRSFGSQLIIALYLSMLLKNIYEIFFEKEEKKDNLQKISANEFPEIVQDYLEKNDLSNKIYQDKSPNKETNAALVGLENDAKIEIYGDFNDFHDNQKNSIILHEVGHAEDHSLLKKLCVFFLLLYFEMLFMLFLYGNVSDSFKCERISKDSVFILLALLYFFSCKDWIFMFYRLSSQRAEIAADLLTSNTEFSKPLANSLFEISVNECSFIRPSWLYNALYAMHPTIYDRIEYLYKL